MELDTTKYYSLATEVALHEERLEALERRMELTEKWQETINTLRVEIGKLQQQIKITWVLLMLVISGLISVAFSIWKGLV